MLIKIKRKRKDKIARIAYLNSESKRNYYRVMRLISKREKNIKGFLYYQKKLENLPLIKHHNYCFITGRGRGIISRFRMSRHQIKSKFDFLHGLTRSSW